MNEIKCKLQRHHKIPVPILEILVGNLPQVSSSSIKEVTEETLDDSKEETDGSDKEWAWGADEDAVSNRTDFTTRSPSPNVQSKETYLISSSASGCTLVLAYKSKFIVVKVNAEEEYSAIGQHLGFENETITCLLCLPLFVPSTRSTQNYIMCGYKSGWIRVFSESGVLLTEQQLETTPVLSIKMRTPPPVFKVPSQSVFKEDEDITILFEGKKVVSIDGQSLWLVLRVCDGQRESGIDTSRMHTAFQYKKWDLHHQDQVKDVVSLGPSPIHSRPSQPYTNSTQSFGNASTRYIGVGIYPMLTYYATAESTRTLSAASMATYVVSRVASPVFSFAKSWWTSGNASHPRKAATPYVPNLHQPPTHIEPATPIPAVLSANDPYRQINQISLCPPSTSSQKHTLAATSDALGRVILWDVIEGEMIRLWKGIRDASCGWVEVFEHEIYQQQQQPPSPPETIPRVLLFLVIHSSKLGSLRIFQMRHGKQVGAFHVGPGWKLVSCAREPLGSSMVSVDRRKKPNSEKCEYGLLAGCLLVSPDGDVRRIEITTKTKLREAEGK
ncbi:hypothetical protein G6F56_000553 [Rhizopus delemar]|nr:hypothetical protein G6F56_000553 [Rhizopus delemar]